MTCPAVASLWRGEPDFPRGTGLVDVFRLGAQMTCPPIGPRYGVASPIFPGHWPGEVPRLGFTGGEEGGGPCWQTEGKSGGCIDVSAL